MKVVASSCGCCGIKHIRDFTDSPHDSADNYFNSEGHDEDQSSSQPEPYEAWNNSLETTPKTQGEWFEGLVTQIKNRRPSGMITVNLVSRDEEEYCCEDCHGDPDDFKSGFNDTQVQAWKPLLTEQGFNEVAFINSNSDNRIHHFTLVY